MRIADGPLLIVLGGSAVLERDASVAVQPLGRVVVAVAVTKVVVLLALANVWGIHRDEFYYLAGGRRLDWGYVDHPPMTPLLYRIGELLFGDSQVGLHTLPALFAGALVIVSALIARELGGGRRARLLTAIGVAVSPMFLTTSHFLSTVSVDILLWSVGLLLVARLLRTGDTRWWIGVGIVAALGLLNKNTMLFWGVGVICGLLATRERALLRDRYVGVGALIALAPMVPYVLWQIDHDWPTIDFLRSLQSHTDMISNPLLYFPFQLVLLGPVLIVIWLPGVLWLLRSPDAARFRPLGIGYLVVLLVVFLLRGKAYYAGSWYPLLFAAGAVRLEAIKPASVGRYVLLLVATAPLAVPFAIPVVPSSSSPGRFFAEAQSELGEMLGWDDLVRQVADIAHMLPPEEQQQLTILTSNYSEAGAIEYERSTYGLPQPISRQNSYWIWGFGPARENGTVIAIGFRPEMLSPYFADIDVVGHATNRAGVENKERGQPILVCRGQRMSWRDIWPHLKTFD